MRGRSTNIRVVTLLFAVLAGGLAAAAPAGTTAPASSQTVKPQPLTAPLAGVQEDRTLLNGVPQTAGMRSGFVHLKPGETVGWHTTGRNEESLIILHGQGKALIDGQEEKPFVAPALVYIPPTTRHNVENTGKEALEYVYVVAPAKLQ